jgi:hypothetical protein
MKAKTSLHALGRILQHSAKEVQRTFAMFEAPQVNASNTHLWCVLCNQVMLKHYFNRWEILQEVRVCFFTTKKIALVCVGIVTRKHVRI